MSGIRPPPGMDLVDKLVVWNASGIKNLDFLAWLNIHKHGWEYTELLNDNIMEEVKQIMLRSLGK